MDEVNRYWEALNRYKETAEQHEFVQLFMIDKILVPAYNDLCAHYDEDHAAIFIRGMKKVFDKLGIELPEMEDKVDA